MQITQTPPIIREISGQWFVVIVLDNQQEIAAPIGEWFAAQFITRVVLPKLVLNAMNDPNQPSLPGL